MPPQCVTAAMDVQSPTQRTERRAHDGRVLASVLFISREGIIDASVPMVCFRMWKLMKEMVKRLSCSFEHWGDVRTARDGK